ncbi:type-1 retrotransposable element r1dm, partial [Lasius niger]
MRRSHFLLNILGEPVPCAWTPRFLGIYLDTELNWKAHIANMKNRINPRINVLKAITGIRWGAHPKILLTIYKGLIRSVLDWSCQIFHPIDNGLDDNNNNIIDSFNKLLSEQDLDITFYTDGSKDRIVFDAEASAIEEAVKYIFINKISKALILSDSLSVLSNLQTPDCSDTDHHSILKIRSHLYHCKKQNLVVKLLWIPSHCGIA